MSSKIKKTKYSSSPSSSHPRKKKIIKPPRDSGFLDANKKNLEFEFSEDDSQKIRRPRDKIKRQRKLLEFGSFDKGDRVASIEPYSVSKDESERIFRVTWRRRQDGLLPKPTYSDYDELKHQVPFKIIQWWEGMWAQAKRWMAQSDGMEVEVFDEKQLPDKDQQQSTRDKELIEPQVEDKKQQEIEQVVTYEEIQVEQLKQQEEVIHQEVIQESSQPKLINQTETQPSIVQQPTQPQPSQQSQVIEQPPVQVETAVPQLVVQPSQTTPQAVVQAPNSTQKQNIQEEQIDKNEIDKFIDNLMEQENNQPSLKQQKEDQAKNAKKKSLFANEADRQKQVTDAERLLNQLFNKRKEKEISPVRKSPPKGSVPQRSPGKKIVPPSSQDIPRKKQPSIFEDIVELASQIKEKVKHEQKKGGIVVQDIMFISSGEDCREQSENVLVEQPMQNVNDEGFQCAQMMPSQEMEIPSILEQQNDLQIDA